MNMESEEKQYAADEVVRLCKELELAILNAETRGLDVWVDVDVGLMAFGPPNTSINCSVREQPTPPKILAKHG